MPIDLTQNPYNDDFDPNKHFHKILFKPSFAVQARELTQSQSILQDQVAKLGRNIFQNGSIVTGGQSMLDVTSPQYICIEATEPSGAVVDVNNFIGKFIVDTETVRAGVRAYVIAGAAATTTSPTVLIVKYTSGQHFAATFTQPIITEDATHSVAIIASLTSPINFTDVTSGLKFGDASISSIQDGVFFVDGVFVQVEEQTIILDAFDKTPTYRIGLQIDETLVDETQDASLLDPAQASTNFQAPGADRYRVVLTLTKRSLTSQDDTKFIELLRVVAGNLTKKVQYPTYSNLEATMARRMDDQSGSFTVRPFKVAFEPHATFSNAYNIVVEAGKAYVQGHEFETIAPTYIKAERARSLANVYRYGTNVDFQNWLEVTNLVGPIPFKTLQAGVLHCVNTASIAVANAAVAANTLMGTIIIRALDYQAGANATSISTAVWRAYMFNSNVAQSIVANCALGLTGTANTIYLAPNFSSVANAYVGVKFTVTSNAGVVLTEHHTIGSYDGPTNKATLQGTETFAFGIPGPMTQFRLDYEFKDTNAIVYSNTSTNQHQFLTTMDVNSTSLDDPLVDRYQGAFLTDSEFNTAFLQLPYPTVADQTVVNGIPLTNSQYFGRKAYTGQAFTQNVTSFVSAAGITSLVNGSPLSGSDAIDNILVVMRNNTGSPLSNNQVINFSSGNPGGNTVTVSTVSNTSTWVITVPNTNSAASADVYVKVSLPYSDKIGSLLRAKTARNANIAAGLNSGGIQIPDANGLVQWYTQGPTLGAQITFYANSAAWLNLKDPTKTQSIFTSDVVRLRRVIDVGKNLIEDGNVAIAADITARYSLDSGQRDNAYEHGSIQLKAGSTGPLGNVVVYVDYLAHSGLGYLTVDSYASANIAYSDIPDYTSPTLGHVYPLRDLIDFRPRRNDGDIAGIYGEELFGISGLNFQTDFSYYLARVDKLVLTKDRAFEVLSGISSLNPLTPADKENAMTLYSLTLPPYTAALRDIRQRYNDNRRYTMRDIGTLEKRITNLEYYTSLNLLEQAAKNQEIVDDTGLNRFKNGILVDSFTGHKIGDVMNGDYLCAIDAQSQELRPPYHLESLALGISETNSTNFSRTGSFVTLAYTVATFLDQPYASQAINVNPFNTITWIGQLKLDPSSDVWVDTKRAPDLHINMEGDNDNWAAQASVLNKSLQGQTINGQTFGTEWNAWQTNWTGVSTSHKVVSPTYIGHQCPCPGHRIEIYAPVVDRQTTSITEKQSRSGVQTAYAPETIQTSIGDKVINESIIPRMRSRGVLFVGKMLAPNTNLYAFFDGSAVTSYCNKPNIVKVNSTTVKYIDTYQQGETVRVFDPARGQNTATGLVILSRNEPTYTNVSIVNVSGGDDANVANSYVMHSTNSTFLIGNSSGANTLISGYYHNTGFVTNPNVSSILLSHDIANSNVAFSNSFIVGQTIQFTSANGLGQSATITSYNANTRNVAFSPSVTVTPNTQTTYSIGYFNSDYRGEVCGTFIIPSTSDLSFRTGERQFTLADTISGQLEQSQTNGVVKYFAQGLLQTVQSTILSTRHLAVQRTVVKEARVVTHDTVTSSIIGYNNIGYYDPLAETFLVDAIQHPTGIMITGVRLMFKTKDDHIPLQVQIRPVVNGFPHSSSVVPGTDTVVNPSDMNTVSEATLGAKYLSGGNPFDDATMYTQINFEGPVYLQQGAEYAIVLIANSIKYQVYISEMGNKIVGTDRIISEQPYLGTLFKSQNSTTWTPVQEQDLAFRLLYAQFDITNQANVEFQLSPSDNITSNIPIDALYVTSGNLLLPNTSIGAMFATTTATGVKEPLTAFQLDENLFFDDTLGRRVASSDTSSFKVRVLLNSLSADVSPVVDMDRLSLYAIENLVNNLELSGSLAAVVASTNNWVTTSNVSVRISGGGGSGANALITTANNIDTIFGVLANVTVDVIGSGYTTAPTVTLSGNTLVGAAVSIAGEDQPFGGPAIARYITRKVTLDESMDAGDFRVFFDAYYPLTAEINVYYKILSADDPEPFDNKGYQLMTIIGGANSVSKNQLDLKSFVYAPGVNGIAADRVQYGTFTSFKYFAIKIVMSATDTTKAPRIRDLRVVALPSLS